MRSFRHVLVGNLFAWEHLSVLPEELEEIREGRGYVGWMDGLSLQGYSFEMESVNLQSFINLNQAVLGPKPNSVT